MKTMKFIQTISFLVLGIFVINAVGLAQNRIQLDLPNEGVMIDNVPVHGNNHVKYTNESIIRINDCIIDIEKNDYKIEGIPNYVLVDGVQIGVCCIKKVGGIEGVKYGVKLSCLYGYNLKKHFSKDTNCHDKEGRIQKTVFVPHNAAPDSYNANDFYLYLGGHPGQKGIEKYDVINEIFDTNNSLATLSIDEEEKVLRIDNRSEKTLFFVAYMVSKGFRQIKRLGYVEISKGENEELSLASVEGVKSATFYVFYCTEYDYEWDCLKHDKKIGCVRLKP